MAQLPKLTMAEYKIETSKSIDNRFVNFFEVETQDEQTFRWSKPVAMLRLEIPVDHYELHIETANLRGDPNSFHFDLYWNGHKLRKRDLQIQGGKISFAVNRNQCVSDREQRLTIACKPLKAEQGRRHLGLPVCWVHLTRRPDLFNNSWSEGGRTLDLSWNDTSISRGLKRLLGKKTPEPHVPIWQIDLPPLMAIPPLPANNIPEEKPPSIETVIVSPVEINARHGTGLLMSYTIEDFSTVATVISRRAYNGDRVRSAAHFELPKDKLSRHEIYRYVLQWFAKSPPARAYVVPYFESDMLIANALKDLFGTQICLHIMDDNCLFSDQIPSKTVEEAIRKSDICFAISPEMRTAYQQRFGMKLWVLPPVVPEELISKDLLRPNGFVHSTRNLSTAGRTTRSLKTDQKPSHQPSEQRGILIGNIWDREWLELLKSTVRESGCEIDWYSNNLEAVHLKESAKSLDEHGIFLQPALWGPNLVQELRNRPFALMPSGSLSGEGELQESIARLSLPSRIPFLTATAQLPIIVMGNRETAAAKFVNRFSLGDIIDYDGKQFAKAVTNIMQPERQVAIRQRAQQLAQTFSAKEIGQWMWESLKKQMPVDNRFEALFAIQDSEFAYFMDAEPPQTIHWSSKNVWIMLQRLAHLGVKPERVIDIGASTGVWSWTASHVFPDAKYVLIDPLMSRYEAKHRQYYLQGIAHHELIEAALSNQTGQTEILVSDDLYGSSLINVDTQIRSTHTSQVEVLRLDDLAREKSWTEKTVVKLDVQYAEHLVIDGGLDFIDKHVDALILELSLEREHPHAKTYVEMVQMMRDLGYELVDEMEGWRNPSTGRLEQKDSVFVRSSLMQGRKAA
ncbi:MAG: FkbM family methyltransferase [Mariniblastus sp.]|nr:FkbM family methyltransferase [Mariniblastus sp.]